MQIEKKEKEKNILNFFIKQEVTTRMTKNS